MTSKFKLLDLIQQKNIIVISGPSGVGKDTLMHVLAQKYPDKIHIAITATTRKPRSNEINKVHHYFYNINEFNKLINNNELIEWAKVYDNYYGVPKLEIENNILKGKKVLIRVDIQGAKRLKSLIPSSLFIFIAPESKKDLKNRLLLRHENSIKDINQRLFEADSEITEADWFDFTVVNYSDQIDRSVLELSDMIGLI